MTDLSAKDDKKTGIDSCGDTAQTDTRTVADVTTDREARPASWYVVRVRSCCEKKTAQRLNALGYETYIPTQTEIRQWSDRRKKVERILLPMMVFVRTVPEHLREIERLSLTYGLLKAPGSKEAAVIPAAQIERLQFMLGHAESEVKLEPTLIRKGDKVRVIRGSLKGLEGYARHDAAGVSKLYITIDHLGCASVSIPLCDIEPVD